MKLILEALRIFLRKNVSAFRRWLAQKRVNQREVARRVARKCPTERNSKGAPTGAYPWSDSSWNYRSLQNSVENWENWVSQPINPRTSEQFTNEDQGLSEAKVNH